MRDGGADAALPPDLMAMKVAALLRDGEYVNLGIGLPTMVSNFIEGRGVTLHAENGILGYGAFPAEGEEDVDLYNASGQLVTPLPETAYFDSTHLLRHGAHRPRVDDRPRRLPGGAERRPGQLEHPVERRRRHRRRHGPRRRRRPRHRPAATSASATAARSWSRSSTYPPTALGCVQRGGHRPRLHRRRRRRLPAARARAGRDASTTSRRRPARRCASRSDVKDMEF